MSTKPMTLITLPLWFAGDLGEQLGVFGFQATNLDDHGPNQSRSAPFPTGWQAHADFDS